VGVPEVLGGSNHIHHFLAPVLDKAAHGGEAVHAAATFGLAYASEAAHGAQAAVHHYSLGFERFMVAFSVFLALVGIGVGYLFYIKNTNLPLLVQFKLPKLHKALLNKWYVDEIYNFALVGGTKQFALVLCWIDSNIVDGMVNGAATVTRAFSSGSILFDGSIVDGLVNLCGSIVQSGSRVLRRMQTGYVQNYALAMVIGLFFLLGIYVLLR